jgi:hypothetical protein
MILPDGGPEPLQNTRVHVVLNWIEELKALVPAL